MSNTMTPERAIEILNPEHREHYDSIETVNEACRIGMDAIGYRIKKKPLIIKHDKDIKLGSATWKAGVPIYKCSCCNSFISRSNKFCPDCGQALDWSDEA